MQPDLRLGLVTWTGQRAILRQPDQEPGWFRGRGVGVQAGCVFVQGTPLQTGRHQGIRRARHAADPRGFRVGLVLAFAREIQAGCQEAWHVPVHEEPQRRVGQALATRQLPRRFLPLLPREIHPAGIASVPAGDVRAFMRQDGAAGVGRQQLQQRQPEPQHVARAAPEPPMLPDAGIAFAVQVDRVQRGAPTWARTCSISRNSAGASAGVRSRPSSGPGGRDEKGRRSIAQPATGKGRASASAATPSAPGSAAYSHSGAVPSASPAPASAASPSSSRDDSFHPDRRARHAYCASGWAAGPRR